jgi:hypothetical protein
VTLKNYGQGDAQNVHVTLEENDEYVSLISEYAPYGSIESGHSATNTSHPFEVQASFETPHDHYARMILRIEANDGTYSDTAGFWLNVGAPGGNFLVFDPDPNKSSGPVIRDILEDMGYLGRYTSDLTGVRPYLANFDAIFVCTGMAPENYVFPASSPDAESLVSYLLNHRGNLYMEGGDLWFEGPAGGGFAFHPYFYIESTSGGSADLSRVHGVPETFTDGMSLPYEGESTSVDHIEATGTAQNILLNPLDQAICGVSRDGGNVRTIGLSFEFGGLRDGTSDRADLMDRFLTFFGIHHGTCGDTDGNGKITPADGFTIFNHLGGGVPMVSCYSGNVDGDDLLSASDGFYMLNYLSGTGPPPNCHECSRGE